MTIFLNICYNLAISLKGGLKMIKRIAKKYFKFINLKTKISKLQVFKYIESMSITYNCREVIYLYSDKNIKTEHVHDMKSNGWILIDTIHNSKLSRNDLNDIPSKILYGVFQKELDF